MLLVCVLITFELAAIIYLLITSEKRKKKVNDYYGSEANVLHAYLDKIIRQIEDFKVDFDIKFGPDLIEKLNAVMRLGEHPKNIVLGEDGKLHKAHREY